MSTALAHPVRYTQDDYLALEAASNVKHEFCGGEIYAMAGGTPEHAALQVAISGLLFARLRDGRRRGFSSDLRVRVLATGLATYPDITVIFGRPERDLQDSNAVTNPTLIVEITSPSSETDDHGDKFEHYKQVASLQQYVIVSQRERAVEVWTRDSDQWAQRACRDGDIAELSSIGAALDVREIYDAAAEPN